MVSFVQLFGKLLMLAAILIFAYFSAWLFGSQYISENSPIQKLFPPLSIALYGPLALLVGFIGFLVVFLVKAVDKMKKKK